MNLGEPVKPVGGTADRPEDLGETGLTEDVGKSVGMPAPGAGHGVIELVNAPG